MYFNNQLLKHDLSQINININYFDKLSLLNYSCFTKLHETVFGW